MLPAEPMGEYTAVKVPCRVKRVNSGTGGKFPSGNTGNIQVMEYSQFLPLIAEYYPDYLIRAGAGNADFLRYLKQTVSLKEFADVFVMTLPHPRVKYYESADYDQIQRDVTVYANQVSTALGYYPI